MMVRRENDVRTLNLIFEKHTGTALNGWGYLKPTAIPLSGEAEAVSFSDSVTVKG